MSVSFDDLRAFQDSLAGYGFAGSDLAVLVGYKPVYRHLTGWENIEEGRKLSEKTVYRMFSMTKPVTVTAAMQLYERGLFQLHDELSRYLPEFADMKVIRKNEDGTADTVPAREPIRIAHIFEMTAGFDYDKDSPEMSRWIDEGDSDHTLADFTKLIASRPLNFEPGSHWRYSVGHDVLARLVEVLSGMTIGEYMRKNIFDPIGMDSAGYEMTPEKEAHLCLRYRPENGSFVRMGPYRSLYTGPKFEGGGAGLVMTVDDYAKFTAMLTNRGTAENGAQILAGSTVDLIRANRLSGVPLRDFQTSAASRAGYGYGLGVRTMIDRAAGGSLSPLGEFGWGGVLGTYMAADPEKKVSFVYGMQVAPTTGDPWMRKNYRNILRNMIYAALEYEGLLS